MRRRWDVFKTSTSYNWLTTQHWVLFYCLLILRYSFGPMVHLRGPNRKVSIFTCMKKMHTRKISYRQILVKANKDKIARLTRRIVYNLLLALALASHFLHIAVTVKIIVVKSHIRSSFDLKNNTFFRSKAATGLRSGFLFNVPPVPLELN